MSCSLVYRYWRLGGNCFNLQGRRDYILKRRQKVSPKRHYLQHYSPHIRSNLEWQFSHVTRLVTSVGTLVSLNNNKLCKKVSTETKKSSNTTTYVAKPSDHDQGLSFWSVPSHWAPTKDFACSQDTSFGVFTCTTKLRRELAFAACRNPSMRVKFNAVEYTWVESPDWKI